MSLIKDWHTTQEAKPYINSLLKVHFIRYFLENIEFSGPESKELRHFGLAFDQRIRGEKISDMVSIRANASGQNGDNFKISRPDHSHGNEVKIVEI